MKKVLAVLISLILAMGCVAATAEDITIEFQQWFEPELSPGLLRGIMDDFEAANPGIKVKLLSGPFSTTKEQVFANAATGTLADLVGVDGAWVHQLSKQGAIANLTELFAEYGFDDSEMAAQCTVEGQTYMVPLNSGIYYLYVNTDILENAGVAIPTTREEFVEAAIAVTNPDENIYGWSLPLTLDNPNAVQNDIMTWIWGDCATVLTPDGKGPFIAGNEDVESVIEMIKTLYDAGAISPGCFTQKESDKIEEFTNGRVAFIITGFAHYNMIKDGNPDLNFTVVSVPHPQGYEGSNGYMYACWGLGVSNTSPNKEAAMKLFAFLETAEINARISNDIGLFPNNVNAKPAIFEEHELFKWALGEYQNGEVLNEFSGAPNAEELMRTFDEQLQLLLYGEQDTQEMMNATQEAWEECWK